MGATMPFQDAMKILVVEDERRIAIIVKKALVEAGHSVLILHDGLNALDAAASKEFDVIVLDVMIPHLNGFQVCEELRKMRISAMILMLTAKSSLVDKLHGLSIGADDYLPKPFDMPELVARVKALGRRNARNKGSIIEVSGLHIDTEWRHVFFNKQLIELQPLEYSLLEYLARNEGRTVHRDSIAASVWQFNGIQSNSIDVHIYKLRKKLMEAKVPNLIHTVHRIGYVLRASN